MYDRKFIFGVFSSSEQYFLCLIKYVFWLAPTGFVVLILTDTVSEEDESRFVKLQPFEEKKKKKKSLICACLNIVNHQTGCGRASLEDGQSSRFPVLLERSLIPMVCTGKKCAIRGGSCYIKNLIATGERKQMFPQHQWASAVDPC